MTYTVYCLVGTAIFYALSSILAFGCTYFPDWNTKSKFVEEFYFRGIYFTKYVSIGKFVYYYIMNAVGFIFVNIVNLQNERKNPILDHHMSPASFYKTLIFVSPAIFVLSSNVSLRGKQDLSSYCKDGAGAEVIATAGSAQVDHGKNLEPMVQLF